MYIFAGLVAVFSLVLVQPAQAMADASSTLSTKYGGVLDNNHRVGFEAAATLVAEGRIGIIFPSSFRLEAGSGAENTVNSSTITVSSGTIATATVSGNSYILWYAAAGGIPALAVDYVTITNLSVAYPASGGSQTLGIQAINTSAAVVEEASSTAFSITAANIAESQTQTGTTTVTPPSSKITSPTFGSSISAGQDYTIKGTAADLGVKDVSKVEVSVDNGSTWKTATLTKVSSSNFTWEYTWTNPAAGSYTIKSRATDTAGNAESPKTGVNITVSTAVSPTPTPTPTPTPVLEKPISEMTAPELQAKITSLQQQLVSLLQQLVALLTQQM